MRWAAIDQNGKVVAHGNCPANAVPTEYPSATVIDIKNSDIKLGDYIVEGKIIAVENRPNDHYEYNVQTREWVVNVMLAAASLRDKRNQLLLESDWTQLDDSPVNKQLWRTYRQALRDLPQQPGFPTNVTWPVQPDSRTTGK